MGFNKENTRPYFIYEVKTTYETIEGVFSLPTSDPNGIPSVVQLAGPRSFKVVRFVVARFGSLPQLPTPFHNDPNEILAHRIIMPQAPILQSDRETYLYYVEGEYRYLLIRPFDKDSTYPMGSLPFDDSQPIQQVLPTSAFTDTFYPQSGGKIQAR